MKAICYNCKHFLNLNAGTKRADIWYSHVCKAYPLPRVFNYVTGKQEPQGYANCRDHNDDGKCRKFEPMHVRAL